MTCLSASINAQTWLSLHCENIKYKWFRTSLNTLTMKWGVFAFNVCVEQIKQLSLSAEHMLSNAKWAVPRQLWVLRTLAVYWGSTIWMLSTFFLRRSKIHRPALQLWGLKASSGHVGIRHRWFSFSPSSGEYVLLHPDFPLSLLILLSFLQSSRWSPGGAGHLLIDLSYILTCVAAL